MLKTEFEAALRSKLRAVPVETRKTWNDTDLYIWWLDAKNSDSYLTWERCPSHDRRSTQQAILEVDRG